ncbi:hypothetical protein BaRGS_00021035 [Batillaria attramentaria]|uniref:Uncharacterized protein n=1 Tax=Batillaria attramentaria TaxID=370345 RepID=A0ABD0KL54_9CAEN
MKATSLLVKHPSHTLTTIYTQSHLTEIQRPICQRQKRSLLKQRLKSRKTTASPNYTYEGHVSPCKTPGEDYLHPVAPSRDTKASLSTTKEATPKTPRKRPKGSLHPAASTNYTSNQSSASVASFLCKLQFK